MTTTMLYSLATVGAFSIGLSATLIAYCGWQAYRERKFKKSQPAIQERSYSASAYFPMDFGITATTTQSTMVFGDLSMLRIARGLTEEQQHERLIASVDAYLAQQRKATL